jgi:subfamily B ATP-binding cassette protein MsbA
MADDPDINASRSEKIDALIKVARYNPKLVALIVFFGLIAAVLEGVGLTFILPIIEIVQVDDPTAQAEGLMAFFVTAYQTVGLPFTLGFVIAGVATVMTVRFTMQFMVKWLRAKLQMHYRRHLQKRAFKNALDARIGYYDEKGSDEILNTILTETYYSARTIKRLQPLFMSVFLIVVYLSIAFIITPQLTALALLVLGALTVFFRVVLEPGFDIGERVADANQRRQEIVQAGTIGIRDVRIFGKANELYEKFLDTVDTSTDAEVKVSRNEAAIESYYQLSIAVFVFVLIYISLAFASLSFGELGLFLFAMFRLGPNVSSLNRKFYRLEHDLPHLIRTQRFVEELRDQQEPKGGDRPVPAEVQNIEFENVRFSYGEDETVLRGIDFEVDKGEFVGFVGQSGVGKSTIVSLLARFYEPDSGRIRANGVRIDEMDPDEWRERIAIVRQSPFIFNDTLRYNLTVGRSEATRQELDRVCEIARVDEFMDELPNGYESELGDDGVKLSGGQKQRVALARAVLADADLLILDEATSDLDSNLEREVQRAIEDLDRDYAIIAIAHRLSTVENADRIYTMEDGRISEQGRHAELVASGGKYSQLYEIQSK